MSQFNHACPASENIQDSLACVRAGRLAEVSWCRRKQPQLPSTANTES